MFPLDRATRCTSTFPFEYFWKPPEISPISAQFCRSGEGNLRVSHPAPNRHVGNWEESTKLTSADVPAFFSTRASYVAKSQWRHQGLDDLNRGSPGCPHTIRLLHGYLRVAMPC
jgi:hypothetical protein